MTLGCLKLAISSASLYSPAMPGLLRVMGASSSPGPPPPEDWEPSSSINTLTATGVSCQLAK